MAKKWTFDGMENNPFERRINCIPVPLQLARTKNAQLLFKSVGCNASSPTEWILLCMIFDGLTHVPSATFALDLMWCLSVACSSCGCDG